MANEKSDMILCKAIGKVSLNVGSRLKLSPIQAAARVYCLINGREDGEYILTRKAEFKNGETLSVDSETAAVGVKAGFFQVIEQAPEKDAVPVVARKKRKKALPKVDPPEIGDRQLPTVDPPEAASVP